MKKFMLSALTFMLLSLQVQAATSDDYVSKGDLLWQQKKFADAELQFKKAIALTPDSSQAHARLAGLYLIQNKTSEAINEYQNAIMEDPQNARLFIGIAIAYLHGQQYEMAQVMVARALELQPDMANAQKLRTYIDAKRQKLAQNTMPMDSVHRPVNSNHQQK